MSDRPSLIKASRYPNPRSPTPHVPKTVLNSGAPEFATALNGSDTEILRSVSNRKATTRMYPPRVYPPPRDSRITRCAPTGTQR